MESLSGSFAVPSVCALITFLSYTSQVLFLYLEPHPLEKKQVIKFNILLVCLLISYARAVLVDPGHIPRDSNQDEEEVEETDGEQALPRKWCRKCDAAKPPRSHHCRTCRRCIPKMDHHCPWTQNCVSHRTFPHFIRFLSYAVASMIYLSYFLWIRCYHLWQNRDLPSYLGPNIFQLGHLFLLCVANFFTLFALSTLLVSNIWGLATNTTTIEGWEIQRHEALVRRARHFGGYLDGPDGIRIRIQKQEYPYDIGFWKNSKQGMGTGNILSWLNPLSATPPLSTGLSFETNGFEDARLSWPPPDPDRLHRIVRKEMQNPEKAFTYRDADLSPEETVAAFRLRKQEDVVRRRKPFVQRLEAQLANRTHDSAHEDFDSDEHENENEDEDPGAHAHGNGSTEGSHSGEEAWRNSEGERLKDFGVDELTEFYDEHDDEDVPLSELLARKRAAAAAVTTRE